MPQNVLAIRTSPVSRGNCVILLYWDPPNNVPVPFISNYVVDYLSGTLMTRTHFTVAALSFENCDLEATTVRIHAVDVCGRTGNRTDNTLAELLQETGVITTTDVITSTGMPLTESTATVTSESDVSINPVNSKSQYIILWYSN